MIDKTIFSVSHDETRYYLNGIFLETLEENSNRKFRMVSTDGYRLSLINRNIDEKVETEIDKGIIIPRKGINEIRKILDLNEDEKYVEFTQTIHRYEDNRVALPFGFMRKHIPLFDVTKELRYENVKKEFLHKHLTKAELEIN